jgi:hypothetical protein
MIHRKKNIFLIRSTTLQYNNYTIELMKRYVIPESYFPTRYIKLSDIVYTITSDVIGISGEIYKYLLYCIYNIPRYIVISGGIYVSLYYIVYTVVSDVILIFQNSRNLWWDLHISLLCSIIEPLIQS